MADCKSVAEGKKGRVRGGERGEVRANGKPAKEGKDRENVR